MVIQEQGVFLRIRVTPLLQQENSRRTQDHMFRSNVLDRIMAVNLFLRGFKTLYYVAMSQKDWKQTSSRI